MVFFFREQYFNKPTRILKYVIPILWKFGVALTTCPNIFPHGVVDDGKFIWCYTDNFAVLDVKVQGSRVLLSQLTC